MSSAIATTANCRPRLALVAPSMRILGGQGVQAAALLERLQGDGYTVEFISADRIFPAWLAWVGRIRYLRTLLNIALYIPALFRIARCDVVQVFSASYWSFLVAPVPAIIVARLLGKRILLHYHSGEADDHLSKWGYLVHPWLKMVDEIVVPSAYLQRVFAHHHYRAEVIPNVIDTAKFRFRRRGSIKPALVSLRNLEDMYRVENTIKAYALIKHRFPTASLTIAGYGKEEERLKRLVCDMNLEDVVFAGRVEQDDLPQLHERADIFVNSSVIDNQPVSILEAFASGLSVVSTPTGDIASMVRHNDTGYVVPVNDPPAMAAAIERLLTNPNQAVEMACRARQWLDAFTWEAVGPKWSAIYAGRI